MATSKKILDFNQKYGQYIIIIAAGLYILFFSFFSLWKYYNFFYNALDLAIINQVFYNSSLGHFFASSIHPPSYLGDHFSPILFLLLPFYLIWPQPPILLILQTIFLAATSWPIYLITKNILNKNWAVLLALAWLINPFVQNINLFETSFLVYAIFFIFWAFYFFQKNKFFPFIIFCLLALFVREDVALVIFMFSPLAWLSKKNLKWWLIPAILSPAYFIFAIKLTQFFAPSQSYKFLVYYSWLGQTWPEMVKNTIFKPWLVLSHFFRIGNLEMILGFILPLAFLPLINPLHLLLALLIFFQIAFGSSGGGQLILQTHYASLFLPAIFISTIFSIKDILNKKNDPLVKKINKYPEPAFIILIAALLYGFLTLGPVWGGLKTFWQTGLISQLSREKQALIKDIPPQSAVSASYDFLANLSSRSDIYSFNYAFLGKQQFLTKDYILPSKTEYLVLNLDDLNTYQLQYSFNQLYQSQYYQARNNWPENLNGFYLNQINGLNALFSKNPVGEIRLVNFEPILPNFNQEAIKINEELEFLGNRIESKHLKIFWRVSSLTNDWQIIFTLENQKSSFEEHYPFAYHLLKLGYNYQGKIIQTDYYLDFKKVPSGTYGLKMKIIEIEKGGIKIDQIRSTKNAIDQIKSIGPVFDVGEITI